MRLFSNNLMLGLCRRKVDDLAFTDAGVCVSYFLAMLLKGKASKRRDVGAVLDTDHAKLKTVLSLRPIGLCSQ